MIKDKYLRMLADIRRLRRAWHYVRDDAADDFIKDFYSYQDYALNLEENLRELRSRIENGTYQASSLHHVDVPKSTLAVRPGSVPAIEDRIVTFGILEILTPIIDKHISQNVYSCRLKRDYQKRKRLFEDRDVPFLKRKTIKKLKIIKEWYQLWPQFYEASRYLFEEKGYKFLAVSDISAYFENINHTILRNQLYGYVGKHRAVVNLLMSILGRWAWQTAEGIPIERGIPQGNEVSSYLGVIYLMPLDTAFDRIENKKDIKYLRYMDDVKIFCKDQETARYSLFIMNRELRELHLNQQGTKTMILSLPEIRNKIVDVRIDEVIDIRQIIETKWDRLLESDKESYRRRLHTIYKKICHQRNKFEDLENRLFRVLLGTFRRLSDKIAVRRAVRELYLNPEDRMTKSVLAYLGTFPKKTSEPSKFLISPLNVFELQQARTMLTLRYMNKIPSFAKMHILNKIHRKRLHWYIRASASVTASILPLSKANFVALVKRFKEEGDIRVKKALLLSLTQLPLATRDKLFDEEINFTSSPELARLACYFNALRKSSQTIQSELKWLKGLKDSENLDKILIDNLFKLFIMRDIEDNRLRKRYTLLLKKIRDKIKNPQLKQKIASVYNKLKKS